MQYMIYFSMYKRSNFASTVQNIHIEEAGTSDV